MPSLFRKILSGHGNKGRSLQEEIAAAKNVAVAEEPTAEPVAEAPIDATFEVDSEARPASTGVEIHQFTLDERGLIPADQLPSAAETLAELFPVEEQTDPLIDELNSLPVVKAEDSIALPSTSESGTQAGRTYAAEEAAQEAIAPAAADSSVTGEKLGEGANEVAAAKTASAPNAPAAPAYSAPTIAQIEEENANDRRDEDSIIAEPPAELEINHAEAVPIAESASEGEAASVERARPAEDAEILKAASMAQLESPVASGRDWQLEERLASHLEWLDSHGKSGIRADLSDAVLEGQELIGVKLKFADLHDANLRAADLLLADLRDATLVRADLEDSCLVGANLEAANLEGASLETAMGLVPRQIAGANLRDALLPPHIMEFPAAVRFARA